MRRVASFAALAIGLGASVATSPIWAVDRRLPCDGAGDVDPNAAFLLSRADIAWNTPGFRAGIHVYDAEGVEQPLIFDGDRDGVRFCVVGGLERDADYTWQVGPWARSPNEVPAPSNFPYTGTWRLHTAAKSEYPPVEDAADCSAAPSEECAGADSGDTG